jgi:phage-related protein
MKEIEFLGDSLKVISLFPKDARQNAGRQLANVQKGNQPDDYNRCRRSAEVSKRFGSGMKRGSIE